jgi:hypothetical protein
MVNKHKKTNSNNKSQSHFSFADLPWKWIIMGIVIFAVLIGITQVIHAIQSISNPFAQMYKEVTNLGAQLLIPCIQQQNCDNIGNDCNKCENDVVGCSCKNNTCKKYLDRPVGSGGFFQPSFPFINFDCMFGFGFVALIFGAPILGIIKYIISALGKMPTWLKNYCNATGKTAKEVVPDQMKRSNLNSQETKEKLKKEGIEITPELSDIIDSISIKDTITTDSYNEANNSTGSLESRQTMINDAKVINAEAEVQFNDNMKDYDGRTKEIIDNNREKPRPEPPEPKR